MILSGIFARWFLGTVTIVTLRLWRQRGVTPGSPDCRLRTGFSASMFPLFFILAFLSFVFKGNAAAFRKLEDRLSHLERKLILAARYANSTSSISQSTPSSSAFLQQTSPTVFLNITVSSVAPSHASAASASLSAAPEQFLAPSASSNCSASRCGASSTAANAPAAYGTAPTGLSSAYLSIASGVLSSIQSASSHNATTSGQSSNHTIPVQVASGYPAQTFSDNLTAAWNITKTRSTTSTTTALGVLVAAVDQLASLSGSNPASVTGLVGPAAVRMASSEEDAATTNALSILLSAAPSDFAQSVESAFESVTSQLFQPTSQPTTAPSPTNPPSQRPGEPTRRPSPSTTPQPPSTTLSLAITSSPPTSSTLMTIANKPTSFSSTSTPSATAIPSSGGQLKNASVAGIATGLAAGAVLFMLAGIYLYRRRQQGKPIPFFGARGGSRGSQRSSKRGSKRIFPEVAWLYDPSRTPREGSPPPQEDRERGQEMEMGHSRYGSAASLVPEPRDGAIELPSAPNSPPQRPSSPLLSPPMGGGRDRSPENRRSSDSASRSGGRRSGSGSPSGRKSRQSFSRPDLQRPMSAIWEEPPRPSVDARTGLLAPGTRNVQRHST